MQGEYVYRITFRIFDPFLLEKLFQFEDGHTYHCTMFLQGGTPDPSDICLGNKYHWGNVFGGTHITVTPATYILRNWVHITYNRSESTISSL